MEMISGRHNSSIFSFDNRKVFFIKLFLFLVLEFIYIWCFVLPQYENGYCASLIDKVSRLESIDDPKIVLLGNSNLSFGIDSSLIEAALGMPVVNMGLHGDLGNAFHEEMGKFNIKEGDIYIVCHSSYGNNGNIGNPMTAWVSIENNIHLWNILRAEDIEVMFTGFPTYLKKCLYLYATKTGNEDNGSIYSRHAFNEYGDIQWPRKGSEYTFKDPISPPGIDDSTVERLNKLNKYITDKGATLLIAAYPIANGQMTVDASEFQNFQKELAEKLDCPVISDYVDYMFDYSYFYNTHLHLNTEGAILRTNQLITDILNWKKSIPVNLENSDRIDDVRLCHINDFQEYLSVLRKRKEKYIIFISAKDEASFALDDKTVNTLRELGVSDEIKGNFRSAYYAVINGKEVREDCGYEKLEVSDYIEGKWPIEYSVSSAGWDQGNVSSIVINQIEHSMNHRGLNFVIYNKEDGRILDSVVFDTHVSDFTATRD